MKIIISTLFCLLSFSAILWSQPSPAAAQSQPILINGATIHVGNGQVIENSFIAFENGKITLLADARTVQIDDSKNYKVIDAIGKHIYPGFIAPNTRLGLTEIGAVRSTRDFRETGNLNSNVRAIIAYNTDSKIIPTIRSNGVLLAQIVPEGGRISGQSSIVQLDAWNWEDAVYQIDDGIHLNWPSLFRFRGFRRGGSNLNRNKKYEEQVREVASLLKEAQAYAKKGSVEEKNLKLEALKGLFDQSKKLFVHTQEPKEIMESVQLAEEFGIQIVIVGGGNAWMIIDFLKEHNVPILLYPTQSLPRHSDADIDQPFKTPAALKNAGILFGFCGDGDWRQRNLPFMAGQAVGFGLDYEAAISSLTLNTAKILGISKTTGSLELGKDATLFLCEGDPLDMRSNIVTQAFIQGREIDLDNKQKALYRKFKEKYEQRD